MKKPELTPEDIAALNDWTSFLSFIPTVPFGWLTRCESKTICVYTGNQFGKTDMVVMDYILRVMGKHPVDIKNVRDTDSIRTFRFASEVLPVLGGDEAGSKNTQYPAFKKRLPPSLIKRDITEKNKTMTIRNLSGGPDIYLEFVAYSQGSGSQAGVQRKSVWLDESAPRSFFDEQVPRLMAADGDMVYTMTPEPGLIGWEFDELYERAAKIMRTKLVRDRMFERFGERKPETEITGATEDITVLMAASDDNPIYKTLAGKRGMTVDQYICDKLRLFDKDEDVMDARRFGLFRHLSGKIFKMFMPSIHVISYDKYFDSVPL
jgi:phage terminase large subunit-like protein